MSAFLAQQLSHYYDVGIQGSIHPEVKFAFARPNPFGQIKCQQWSPAACNGLTSCTVTKGQSNRIKKRQ